MLWAFAVFLDSPGRPILIGNPYLKPCRWGFKADSALSVKKKAHALARVDFPNIHGVEVVRNEQWMRPAQSGLALQYMHQDQVERLPENGVVIGRSDHCPVAMFRAGDSSLGIQGHPEFPKAYSEALLLDRTEGTCLFLVVD